MAKQEFEKLRDALYTIKNECEFHGSSCGSCPLASDTYVCGVTGEKTCGFDYDYKRKPMYWDILPVKLMGKKQE